MSPALLLGLIFVATFGLVVLGLYFAASRMNLGVETVNDATPSLVVDDPEAAMRPLLLKDEGVSSISFWAGLLERFQFVPQLRKLIAEAGLTWSVGRFSGMVLLGAASTAVVLSRVNWLPWYGIAVGAVFVGFAPILYLQNKRTRRFRAFEEAFPDALDSLGRAMRAGHALAAGLEMVTYEADQPVSGEFRKVLEEWRLGRSWDQAFDHLMERVPLVSVSLFVAAVRMQSRTGGKLHEILARISEGVRESSALEGEIRAISAHGKLTGLILSILPIGIAMMLNWTAPGYLDILIEHPLGKFLIMAAVLFLVAAHFVMRKILDIKI